MHPAAAILPVSPSEIGVRDNQILRLGGLQSAVRALMEERQWSIAELARQSDTSRVWMSQALNADASDSRALTFAEVLAEVLSKHSEHYNVEADHDYRFRVRRSVN